ncbi:MAG: DUF4157 domain-containing protein [Kofleriaceae bacterium]
MTKWRREPGADGSIVEDHASLELGPGKRSGTAGAPNLPPPRAPGKRTLTQHFAPRATRAPQRDAGPYGEPVELPFLDRIQSAFGRHDVGSISAYLGPLASEAAQAHGARAFASGTAIVFDGEPDLHTVAHEAAHIIQQRAGLAHADPELYERNADAIADAVVAGQPVELLLDRDVEADGSGSETTGAIQRKKPGDGKAPKPPVELPDGMNLQIQSDGSFIVRTAWLESDPGKTKAGGKIVAPNRNAEILRAYKAANILPWMEDAKIPALAANLSISSSKKGEKFAEVHIGFGLYAVIGPPPGVEFMFGASGKDIRVVIRQDIAIPGPITKKQNVHLSQAVLTRLWTAFEQHTEIPIEPAVKTKLISMLVDMELQALPDQLSLEMNIEEVVLHRIYGKKVWDDHLKKPKKDQEATGLPVAAAGGVVTFSPGVPEPDRQYFLEWTKQLGAAAPDPSAPPSSTYVSPETIAKMREIDKDPLRAKILEKLKGGTKGKDAQSLDAQYLDNAINAARTEKARDDLGLPAPTGKDPHIPLFAEPVHGSIVNRGGLNYVGQNTEFYFETDSNRDAIAIPYVTVKWVLTKKDTPKSHLKTATTRHVQHDTAAKFDFSWPETGLYTVHAFVTHTFYQPTEKSIDVEVKTETERMNELGDKAYNGLKGKDYHTEEDWPFDVSTFNTIFGSHKQEYGKRSWGHTPADFKRLSFDERTKFLTDDRKQLEDLIAQHGKDKSPQWQDMVSYAKHKLKTLAETDRLLTAELLTDHKFFEARGSFLSRQNGVPDKQLKLVGAARKKAKTMETVVHDFTQLYEPVDYKFSGSGSTFAKAIEEAFIHLCKSYPSGRVSCMFEVVDEEGNTPGTNTLTFEFDTGTAWKDVKSVVFNPTVMLVANILGAVTMVFLPMTAPILFPILGAYNSAAEIDHMVDLHEKGILTWGSVAKGVAMIGMNFLPYIGEMKQVAALGKTAMYTLEGITLAGNAVMMTIDGVQQIRELRDRDISEIAKLDSEIRQLEHDNKSDPTLPDKRKQLDTMIANAQAEATRVLESMAKSGAIMLTQMAGLKALQTHMTNSSVEALRSEGRFVDGHGEPVYDPHTGTIRGDAKLMDTGKLAKLKQSYSMDMAAKQAELANVLGTDNITITRGGEKVTVTKDGDGYKVEIPLEKSFADALDEAWTARQKHDPNAPKTRPEPVIVEVKATFDPAEVATKQQVAVGNRVGTVTEGEAILAKLAGGDTSAFKQLGLEAPAGFDPRTVEWGLGQMPDGSFVIIRGASGDVNWGAFKGVRPVAHSHPLTGSKRLGGDAKIADIITGRAGEKAKIDVFPSARDIAFTNDNFLGEHTVQTGYASKGGGVIGNPTPGAGEPLVQMKIQAPERIGSWAGNPDIGVYKTKITAQDTNGKVLWTGEIYAVDHPVGSLISTEMPSTLVTKGDTKPGPAGKSTPAGIHDPHEPVVVDPAEPTKVDPAKAADPPAPVVEPTIPTAAPKPKLPTTPDEIPPNDRVKIHKSSEGHAERVGKGIKDITPEGEQKIRDATIAAEEAAYLEKAKTGAKPEKRVDAAKFAGNKAAKLAADKVAVEIAEKAADQAISDGSVFGDLTDPKKSGLAKTMNSYEGGTTGQAAKRLAPLIEGKTFPEVKAIMDAEVAANRAKPDPGPIADPTDPTGKATQQQEVYDFPDGTRVRMKPKGDGHPGNPGKPMYSVEVKIPGSTADGQPGISFKVDGEGRPVPKGPDDIKNPYNNNHQTQADAFRQRVIDAGHRKTKPES